MRAGFERDIGCGAACGVARLRERHRLGMRAAAGLGPAATDDTIVADDDAADIGIGRGAAARALGERERGGHPARIVRYHSPILFIASSTFLNWLRNFSSRAFCAAMRLSCSTLSIACCALISASRKEAQVARLALRQEEAQVANGPHRREAAEELHGGKIGAGSRLDQPLPCKRPFVLSLSKHGCPGALRSWQPALRQAQGERREGWGSVGQPMDQQQRDEGEQRRPGEDEQHRGTPERGKGAQRIGAAQLAEHVDRRQREDGEHDPAAADADDAGDHQRDHHQHHEGEAVRDEDRVIVQAEAAAPQEEQRDEGR
ncbi:hypothetical protein WR25_16227 [Diploscapter pachys]|uniref:Uncharacterized protein n=1 Tax=Diploscapter pachys TaxID=2018661 RepID=A0A2A2KCM8_9BILA|nr:hypothetical protein WR25_16227 [Diploscapter pachys]